MRKQICLLLTFLLVSTYTALACTSILVTRGASKDGSTMISYAADAHVLYGELYYWPAQKWPQGSMRDIYEWDTGKFLGQIKQAAETYNVVGNMNQFQVAIGESTFGGRKELEKQTGAIMDYGSLKYVALQRSKTAREAIKVIATLMEEYGYFSAGESFSIADKNEVWYMELIGKGEGEKGAIWVAKRIPEGYVSAHANHARIMTFPLANGKTSLTSNDWERFFNPEVEVIYAHDVITFARKKGWYEGDDKDFSFSCVYAPISFTNARFCEMRVWAIFRRINSNMEQYKDYASGHNLKNRMPLWVKADNKLTVTDVKDLMRDHYQGTEFCMTLDIGAGPFAKPYRWRPLTWKVDGVTYFNERAVATQQTGFGIVSQSRAWLPDEVGGILWFSVDDAGSTVYFPMYSSATRVPETFAVGNGKMMTFSWNSAFWIFNLVSNWAYTKYNHIHPEIREKQLALEKRYTEEVKNVDKAALELLKKDNKLAVEFLTQYSVRTGNELVNTWKEFFTYLFMKHMDGNIKEYIPGEQNPKVVQPGYDERWKRNVIEETSNKLRVVE